MIPTRSVHVRSLFLPTDGSLRITILDWNDTDGFYTAYKDLGPESDMEWPELVFDYPFEGILMLNWGSDANHFCGCAPLAPGAEEEDRIYEPPLHVPKDFVKKVAVDWAETFWNYP